MPATQYDSCDCVTIVESAWMLLMAWRLFRTRTFYNRGNGVARLTFIGSAKRNDYFVAINTAGLSREVTGLPPHSLLRAVQTWLIVQSVPQKKVSLVSVKYENMFNIIQRYVSKKSSSFCTVLSQEFISLGAIESCLVTCFCYQLIAKHGTRKLHLHDPTHIDWNIRVF